MKRIENGNNKKEKGKCGTLLVNVWRNNKLRTVKESFLSEFLDCVKNYNKFTKNNSGNSSVVK